MIRLWLSLLALVLCGSALAQTSQVVVRAELANETTVVGQPLILRITVLVPTWMPEPPRFPSLEAPNMIVRLPSRASSPVSERIDGETWSGVSRAYRLYPMIPGEFSIRPQPIAITYSEAETRDPISVQVELDPLTFRSTIPKGAESLNPLIVAEGFSLDQSFEGAEGTLKQGDAVTRVVMAKISGTSALFIPPLTPPVSGDAVRSYPRDPVVSDSEASRGTLSGSRRETTSYVAQYGGTLEFEPIAIDWFNTKTDKIETATLNGMTLSVDAPPAPKEPLLDGMQVAKLIVLSGFLVMVLYGLSRYAIPLFRQRLNKNRAIWQSSEAFAARQVKRAISSRDLSAVYSAMAVWSARCPEPLSETLEDALANVGRLHFQSTGADKESWAVLSAAFQKDRDQRLWKGLRSDLPPLNPL